VEEKFDEAIVNKKSPPVATSSEIEYELEDAASGPASILIDHDTHSYTERLLDQESWCAMGNA
jgi:hypothetical protein